jgi:hypothetical protein
MSIFGDILGEIIKPVAGLIDSLHTSDEEKLEAKAKLRLLSIQAEAQLLEYQQAEVEAKAKIIVAEAGSNWYTASWRPTLMYCFILIFLYSIPAAIFHWPGVDFSGIPERAWTMLTLGIGGYVGGRTVEKTLVPAVKAWKAKEEA